MSGSLGLSKSRLILLVTMFLCVGIVGFLAAEVLRIEFRYKGLKTQVDEIYKSDGHITTILIVGLAGFVGGIIFLMTTFATTDLFLKSYYIRLAPWMFWFTMLCGQTLIFSILYDFSVWKNYMISHGKALLVLVFLLVVGLLMHTYLWDLPTEDWDVNKLFNYDDKFDIYRQDIYAVFREGTNLIIGINPYSRVHELGSDLTWNFEIPTYFPIFYMLNWFTQKIGFDDFFYWLDLWRVVFLLANLGIAYIVFFVPYHRYNSLWFAFLGTAFWLFSRWSLHITMIYHIDFLAIFFFVLSLVLWPRYKVVSLLSFGVSLGFKQIAIFMIPLYMIWIYQTVEVRSLRRILLWFVVLFSVPLLVTGPFLIWDASGFIKSVFLSATRNAESHFGIPSIDALLAISGIPAKIPMLSMMGITFLLAWKRSINHFVAALFIMLIFVNFNSVLFRQYMTWIVPLVPLALSSSIRVHSSAETNP